MRFCMLLLACFQQAEIFSPTGVYSKPESVSIQQDAKPRQVFLAMWTATYCGPCRTWKQNVKGQVERLGYFVREYEMTDKAISAKYSGRIARVPSFAVIDANTGEWITDVTEGAIDLATAEWMLDGSVLSPPTKPATVQAVEQVESPSPLAPPVRVSAPNRYIQWPGWGQIDLETYNRNCDCGMCQSIRAQQAEYRRQLELFKLQSTVSPDQEGTPDALVTDLLDKMQLQTGDVLAELGCGDGRILIAAAKRGIRGIGIELDPARAQVARENVQRSGLSELITVETGDALEFDFSRVTCATCYLYPPLLAKLSPKLKSLRVVGSPYHEVPGLPMTQYGDVWIYRNGDTDENVVANNIVGSIRGNRSVAGSSTDSAR